MFADWIESVRYAMIDKLRHTHPVAELLQLVDVAKSGYQAWSRGKVIRVRKPENAHLLAAIKAAHQRGRGIYGAKKIQTELAALGIPTNEAWLCLAAIKDLWTCDIIGSD